MLWSLLWLHVSSVSFLVCFFLKVSLPLTMIDVLLFDVLMYTRSSNIGPECRPAMEANYHVACFLVCMTGALKVIRSVMLGGNP